MNDELTAILTQHQRELKSEFRHQLRSINDRLDALFQRLQEVEMWFEHYDARMARLEAHVEPPFDVE